MRDPTSYFDVQSAYLGNSSSKFTRSDPGVKQGQTAIRCGQTAHFFLVREQQRDHIVVVLWSAAHKTCTERKNNLTRALKTSPGRLCPAWFQEMKTIHETFIEYTCTFLATITAFTSRGGGGRFAVCASPTTPPPSADTDIFKILRVDPFDIPSNSLPAADD